MVWAFEDYDWGKNLGLISIILISWGLAFFEYVFQVPANRAGFKGDSGPYTLAQLKTIQEAITLTVFMIFSIVFFKTEKLGWNHLVGFGLIVLAGFVIFKKWQFSLIAYLKHLYN